MKNWLTSLFSKPNKTKDTIVIKDWSAYEQAKNLFLIKHPEERDDKLALFFLDKAIESGIKEAHFERAFCLQSLQFYFDAIEDFNQAIQNSKSDANLYYSRGHCKMIVGEYDQAISDLQMAIEVSRLPNKTNEEYDDEMRKSGWSSATQFFDSHLQQVIDRKKFAESEHLKDFYLNRIKEIKRRLK